MSEASVHIEAEVNPTEDPRKVKQALEKIFGNLQLEDKWKDKRRLLIAQTNQRSLINFGNLLRRERIRNAARIVFFQGLKGNTITFCLNKQVAFAGHVSFCEPVAESPLGPIMVEIECDDPSKIIHWLAPRTT